MKTITNRTSALNKLISCLMTFLLVFSMTITPAYAVELSLDPTSTPDMDSHNGDVLPENSSTATEQQPTTGNVTEEIPEGFLDGYLGDDNLGDDEGDGEEKGENEGTNEGSGEGENEGEGNGEEETTAPKNSGSPLSATLTADYDDATHKINCSVVITNVSDHVVSDIQYRTHASGSSVCSQMADATFSNYENNENFSLEVSASRTIYFSYEVPTYENLDVANACITINGIIDIPEGFVVNDSTLYSLTTNGAIFLPMKDDISFTVDIATAVYDENGNKRAEDESASVGDIIYVYFTIANTGYVDITDITYDIKNPFEIISDTTDATNIDINKDAVVETRHVVDEDDVLNGIVGTTLLVTINNNTTEHSVDVCKVATDFPYRIRYFMEGATEPFEVITDDSFRAEVGEMITLNESQLTAFMPSRGYAVNEPSLTITASAANNNIDVIYAPKTFDYTINYYKDNTYSNPIDSSVFSAAYGSEITLSDQELNAHVPVGYKPLTISPSITISDDDITNVLNVVYSEREMVGYTIRYFKDSTDSTPIATLTGEAAYDSMIMVVEGEDEAELNYALPTGYAPLTSRVTLRLGLVDDNNMLDIVYTEKNSYPLTINYYFDSDEGEPAYSYITSQTYEFDSIVEMTSDVLNAHLPEGYVEKNTYDYIVSTENVIKIVYSKQSDIAYTINFYAGSVNENNRLGDAIIGSATYMENVTPTNVNERKPAVGYDDADVDDFIISANPDNNNFNVVYPSQMIDYTIVYRTDGYNLNGSHRYIVLDERYTSIAYGTSVEIPVEILNAYLPEVGYQAKGENDVITFVAGETVGNNVITITYQPSIIQYNVHYYKDSIDGELIATETFNGLYGSVLTLNPALLNFHQPAGYNPVSGYTRVIDSLDYTNNDINVVYDSKRSDLAYTIEYYLGSISGEPYYTSNGVGTYGDEIPYVAAEYQPEGYTYDAPEYEDVIIGVNENTNVLRVVYPAAEYGYTVNYYQDEVTEKTLLGTDTGVAAYNSYIPYTLGAYMPEGYDATRASVVGVFTVGLQEEYNVVNVVYGVRAPQYTVNYYGGSIAPENLLRSTAGYADAGTNIPYDINSFVHAGYEGEVEVYGDPIVRDGMDNVLNVVIPVGMYEYVVEYYADSVDANNYLGREEGRSAYMSAITATRTDLVPVGYSAEASVEGNTVVTPNENSNVMYVVYKPANYRYSIYYYVDSEDADNYLGEYESTLEGTYGTLVEIPTYVLNYRLQQGYQQITDTRLLRITENVRDNVVVVVYEPIPQDEPVIPMPDPTIPEEPNEPVVPDNPVDVPGNIDVVIPSNPTPSTPGEGDVVNVTTGENNNTITSSGDDRTPAQTQTTPTVIGGLQDILNYVANLFTPTQPVDAVVDDNQTPESTDDDANGGIDEDEEIVEDELNPLSAVQTDNGGDNSKGNAPTFVPAYIVLLTMVCGSALGALFFRMFLLKNKKENEND